MGIGCITLSRIILGGTYETLFNSFDGSIATFIHTGHVAVTS